MYAPHVVLLWLPATLAALMIATGTLALLAAFGSIGQLLAMLLLIYLSLASSGGTVPIQALPGIFNLVGNVEPLRQVLAGTRAILYFSAKATPAPHTRSSSSPASSPSGQSSVSRSPAGTTAANSIASHPTSSATSDRRSNGTRSQPATQRPNADMRLLVIHSPGYKMTDCLDAPARLHARRSSRALRAAAHMTRRLTLLFAATTGIAVANLYYVQPLLALIGGDLHTPSSATGLLVTATQVGYVLGILLIVPLGDARARHRLIPTMMALSAGALVLCAAAPSFPALTVGLLLVGLTTVSGQLITAFAGDLADDRQLGRVVGTVVSGLLVGILGARILGGLIAELAGWRVRSRQRPP